MSTVVFTWDKVNIMTLLKSLLNGSLNQLMLEWEWENVIAYLHPHLLLMNFCKLYYKDRTHVIFVVYIYMVLAVSCWLLNISCLYCHRLWWFQFPIFFHSSSYNYFETFAHTVCYEDIWPEGILTLLKQQQWNPTYSTCLGGGCTWSKMFIIHFRLSFKWKYFLKFLHNS